MPNRGDISRLAGWLSEPYRKDAVLAAAKTLQPPFLLREIVEASGLPTPIVHSILGRLVKQRVLTRAKARISYPTVTGAGKKGLQPVRWIPNGRQRRVYLYSWAD